LEGRTKNTIIKKMTSVFLFLIVLGINNFVHAEKNLEIRELDTDFLEINDINSTKNSVYSSEEMKKIKEKSEIIDTPMLKGEVTELKAIVAKYRIFKFDKPIKRFAITNADLVEWMFLSEKEMLIIGEEAGETTVMIWEQDSDDPVFFNLFVEKTNYNFIKEVKKIAPNENINIDFIDEGGKGTLKVVLTGKISSTIVRDKIKEMANAYSYNLVDLTEAHTPQVLLEVKLVEMTKDENKNREINFKEGLFDYLELGEELAGAEAVLKIDGETFDEPWTRDLAWEMLSNLKNFSAGTETITLDDLSKKGHVWGNSFGEGQLNVWRMYPNKNLSYQLKAAESEGIVKILAEPRLMVSHGEMAKLESVQQVPVPAGQDALTGAQITEYKDVGIIVEITPTILEESKRVNLTISTELSDLSTAASIGESPGFVKRNGQTKVEIADNQTTVITGLVRSQESKTVDKLPFFSNLPIIGDFFSSIRTSKSESEVMIFVTATIIKSDLAKEL